MTPKERLEKGKKEFENDWMRLSHKEFYNKYYRGS